MHKSLVIIGLFYSWTAFAAGPQITGVAGASNYTLPTTTGTTTSGSTTIFGGLAGDCSDSGTGTCNSCVVSAMTCPTAADGLCPCNTTRIHVNTSMAITAKRTDTTTGPIRIAVANSATTYVTIGSGTGDTVSLTWENVCSNSDLAGPCAGVVSNKTINAKIFIDKNSNSTYDSDEASVATDFTFKLFKPDDTTYAIFGAPTSEGIGGAQGFVPYPGDAKIYLEYIDATTNFPTLSYGTKALKVRVFHSSEGLASVTAESADWTDISVTADGATLDRSVVSNGLTNNTTYIFRIAMVDEANNVVQFFPAPAADATCDDASVTVRQTCPWAATPEEVLGLLTNDFNCFIATAAYGSFLEPKLKTFRDFKFKILLRSKPGRAFVEWYYKYGPYAARWIYDKPWLRAVTQAALWPVYIYSSLALKAGFWPATSIAFLLLILMSSALIFAARRGFGRST